MIQTISLLLLLIAASRAEAAEIDQAKKDGEVVLYTTMVVSDFQLFHKALVRKYPFLKVNHVHLGAAALVARAAAEYRAGKKLTDVYGVSRIRSSIFATSACSGNKFVQNVPFGRLRA